MIIISFNFYRNLFILINILVKQDGIYCKCIRCREFKEKKLDDQFILTTRKYRASSGIEYFISAESSDHMTLYGFVRLRIPSIECFWTHRVFPELTKCALIRELQLPLHRIYSE